MKKGTSFWLQIHFYCGLVASLYLLIIGISAFNYSHHMKFFMQKENKFEYWERDLEGTYTTFDNEELLNINEELGIFGHIPWWEQHTDGIGNFTYITNRLGKKYYIEIVNNGQHANVSECNTGIGTIITGLHTGSAGGPKSTIMTIWKWFANIATVLAFIAITSSIVLWYKRSFKKIGQWVIALVIAGLSLFYILYIWLVG